MTPERLNHIAEMAEGDRWDCDNGLCDYIEELIDAVREGHADKERAYADGARAMKYEMLRIAMRLTYDGQLWPELMLRLREASVHEGEDEE